MAKTLLLADDSVTIQKVVGISFANEDISITTVDNGDDALIKARELRPDVVLADVVMPGKSGYEVCEGIKKDPELRHIPVLLLTGTFEAFDEERAARIGAAGHVAKPFEAQTLVDRVKQLLGRAPAPARAAAAPAAPQAASAPAADDDSFDFFDDALGNESSRDTAIEGASEGPSLEDSLSLESADAAFAFGEDDLAPPAPPEPRPDATIAMLPDKQPRPAAIPAPPGDDPALTTVDEAMFDAAPEPPRARPPAAPPAPPAPAEDAFDFEFQTAPPEAAPPAPPRPEPAEPEELAQATILDPKLGSNFAVSSSDLDSTFSPMPAAPRPPGEASAQRAAPGTRPLPAAPIDDSEEEPLSSDLLGAEPMFEPDDLAFASAVEAPGERFRPGRSGTPEPQSAEATRLPAQPAPMAPTPAADPPKAPPPPRPAPQPVATAQRVAPQSLPSADVLTEQIAPVLRAELHETLEKIAWESFGQMAERIVEEVIQRVETVAWDVVPKLAEALIREEIRKLKGGVD